ncbi:MAG: GNAT family N-acetyltransferase [Chloroflexota bacterium]|nr:MAG: GNAT family N-acetyltransferase [Chloroflexota bacterium]
MTDKSGRIDLPTLETERLLLRRLRDSDLEDLFAFASNPVVADYLSWEPHRSYDDTQAFLRHVLQSYRKGDLATWGIEHREDRKVIGTAGFVTWYRHDARAEIAYAIGREYWEQGYATEAVSAIIVYGFETMQLNRIEARCIVDNVASARVMEKARMRYEGTLREHMLVKGTHRNFHMYSILKREYKVL